MAPLLKEKIEAATTGAEQAGSPAISQGRVAGDHLSADAVSLEVPVNIHGSRVTDAVRGATAHTEPFEEQTTTMIVFPQGGVLRMATAVTAGQMLVLTNLKSRQDAICRVVKVRTYSSVASYVEVEFTHSQAGYWGVFFSSDGPELAKKASGNLSLESLEPAPEFKPAPGSPVANPSTAPLPRPAKDSNAPSTLGVPLNRNESSFISIGSQEEVQLSATSTTFKSGPSATLENQRPVIATQKDQTAAAQLTRTASETREPRALSDTAAIESPNAGEGKSSAATLSTQNSAGTFGDVFGGSSRQITSTEQGVSPSNSSSSQNWKLLVGGATLGIVVATGAFFLFRPSVNGNTAAKPATSPAAEVQPVATQPVEPAAAPSPTPTHNATTPASSTPPKNNLVAEAKRPEPVAESVVKTPKPDEAIQTDAARPAPVAKHNVPDVTSDLFGALNAHPVAGRTAEKNQAEIAPSVSASAPALSAAGTPEIIPAPSAVDLPVPSQAIPGTVLQAGGSVPEPRLLSSTLPTYPAAAKQTRTEGDIVVRTVIDEHGQVTNPQVVSGPTLLRQAAIDALKHWKYEPSHVNGKPVPVQILLTIHFRL